MAPPSILATTSQAQAPARATVAVVLPASQAHRESQVGGGARYSRLRGGMERGGLGCTGGVIRTPPVLYILLVQVESAHHARCRGAGDGVEAQLRKLEPLLRNYRDGSIWMVAPVRMPATIRGESETTFVLDLGNSRIDNAGAAAALQPPFQ
jgi:hypothetical protein